jgi:hypothetical protein
VKRKKPLAQGKRPIQVRANIITDGGDHDDNDENNRRGDQNWLWLPTCNIRLMQFKNNWKITCDGEEGCAEQLPKEKYPRPGWLGPYEKTKKDERQRPEMQTQKNTCGHELGFLQHNQKSGGARYSLRLNMDDT